MGRGGRGGAVTTLPVPQYCPSILLSQTMIIAPCYFLPLSDIFKINRASLQSAETQVIDIAMSPRASVGEKRIDNKTLAPHYVPKEATHLGYHDNKSLPPHYVSEGTSHLGCHSSSSFRKIGRGSSHNKAIQRMESLSTADSVMSCSGSNRPFGSSNSPFLSQ